MEIRKLAPWNWFKKEEEDRGTVMPVKREDRTAPVRYTDPMLRIHDEIDRLFENFFRGFGFPSLLGGGELPVTSSAGWLKPTLDVGAADNQYTISVELPGVEPGDVHLEVSGDTLKISGEKKQEKEHKEKDYYRIERSYGSFQRVLSLPEDADSDGITAECKNGVMKITIPRKQVQAKGAKRIEIKSA